MTPGQAYTFTDEYTASVDTEIDARYKVLKAFRIAGECSPDSDASYVDCTAEVYPALWSRAFANKGRTGDQHDASSLMAGRG